MASENHVGDYYFLNQIDAVLARKEDEKIKQLEEKMDYSNIPLVYKVYNKCIETRAFKTPIGTDFMHKMFCFLKENPQTPGDVVPIPLYNSYEMSNDENLNHTRIRIVAPKEKTSVKEKLKWSFIINAVLLFLVIAMFVISTTGKNPTILNYENALINKYSEWEQELNERESQIREREEALDGNETQ